VTVAASGIDSVRWIVIGADCAGGGLAMTVGVLSLRMMNATAKMANSVAVNCRGVIERPYGWPPLAVNDL
jgi:hypothetical protein